jgi:hypothetical protein
VRDVDLAERVFVEQLQVFALPLTAPTMWQHEQGMAHSWSYWSMVQAFSPLRGVDGKASVRVHACAL